MLVVNDREQSALTPSVVMVFTKFAADRAIELAQARFRVVAMTAHSPAATVRPQAEGAVRGASSSVRFGGVAGEALVGGDLHGPHAALTTGPRAVWRPNRVHGNGIDLLARCGRPRRRPLQFTTMP